MMPDSYERDGIEYARVTDIIGKTLRTPALEEWRGRLGNQRADLLRRQAADYGHAVHDQMRLICAGQRTLDLDDEDEAVQTAVDTARRWLDETVREVVAVEEPVYNEAFRYAGTPDLIRRLKGDRGLTVVDWKTGAGVYESYKLQTAAYQHGDGLRVKRRLIVNIKRQTPDRAHVVEYVDHDEDFRVFCYLVGVYHWLAKQ